MSKKSQRPTTDGEVGFLRRYKEAIYYFNMLDRNMAYCIRAARQRAGTESAVRKIHAQSFDTKLGKINSIIKAKDRVADYHDFSELAEQCRLLRNRLVHGHWEFKDWLKKPIHFHVPSPLEESGALTHEEFAVQTAIFEQTLTLFNQKRNTHPIEGPDRRSR